ncbi:hypothetical protein HDA32_004726 [Spinactinospora alkalitolerans]|uniref:Uncharacterized protein n=1 Tax=Spinactinospora alkalitolerans TaxID=687207 RepID=A0A852TYH6_9ACTN|nr:hypothetical protein [Spinactinospora alkalitolerans]NYE49606.1 hypothetical protein [Spinactinospora alkalitolerans]
MTTTDMVRQAGALALLLVLALTLAVTLLRLLSLPLAVAALALDTAADLAAAPLTAAERHAGGDR